ncbi:MAG TPA: hypothetical protein VMA96_11665 [Solirubrobacteraceae bacterium]|nr:hypothetical protein [Solirubrobacteraceae bacterium]
MRLNRGVRTFAAIASLAAATSPAAYANDIREGGGNPVPTAAQVATAHRNSSSTDWALIAIGAGGAVVLVGAGVGGSRAHSRRRRSTGEVGAARIS